MKRIMKPILLEVIVQTVDDARAADAGGADRLEVVRDINRDGLTPSIDVVRSIQAATRLPLRVMVRESATFTVGVDGLVLGFTRGHDVSLPSRKPVRIGFGEETSSLGRPGPPTAAHSKF